VNRPPDEPEDFGFDVDFDFETAEGGEEPPRRGIRSDVGRIGDTIAGLAGRGGGGADPDTIRRRRMWALAGLLATIALVVGLVVALGGGGDGGEEQATPPELIGPAAPPTLTSTSAEPPASPPAVDTLPTDATLRPGDTGDEVAALQQALIVLGYDVGEPDGDYGPATEQAVAAFQEAEGLEADGVAGSQTLTAINEALAEQPG
jgi:hypothetical protein